MTPYSLPSDTLSVRIARDFFSHSGHVPLVLVILEALLAPGGYFLKPDAYVLLVAGLGQSCVAVLLQRRGRPLPLLANLSGPLLYSLVESALEGAAFFAQWHHQAYWAFALAFGLLQSLPPRATAVMAENLLRSAVPLVMYALFEARMVHAIPSAEEFLRDPAHAFLAIVLLLLGVLLGLADVNLRRSLDTIAALTLRLREYSGWALGGGLLDRAIADERVLALQRIERSVVFMDIRGFTAWSERQSPEAVVELLNRCYGAAEQALKPWQPVKIKFTADEVMAVFGQPQQAIGAAQAMLRAATEQLAGAGLAAGAGLHHGPLVEGVLGGEGSRAYDFIGDTVNTAKRLCDAAGGGEVLASARACELAGVAPLPQRQVHAKGKSEPLQARVLQPLTPERPARSAESGK